MEGERDIWRQGAGHDARCFNGIIENSLITSDG